MSRSPAAGVGLMLLLSSCLTPRTALPPSVAVDSETVRTVAGAQYERGRLHRWLWGTHYRNIWATPVNVPVLRLATAVPGGFTPLREGGSFQTKNLRLETLTGREYVLRSVDKDATHALPLGLRESWVGRLMKDQTSVIHPYGAYIVPALADAAGVYHTNPRLVYLGDDPGLGEFRASFANALYLLEERPDGDQRAVASFGRSNRVVSSRQAFEHLLADNRHRVDARHYLRSRLFDMWLGDWSRREDQWRWATYARPDSAVLYRAIPRDRDHAFFKFDDGVLTRLISYIKANYQSFGHKIRLADVEGLNQAARPMDKSLLVYLTADDYQQVADSLRLQLSDTVIDRALQEWPVEIQALSVREFGDKLRARRGQLPAVAARFYELLARDVELPGTDRAERFDVEGLDGRQLRVRVLDAASGRVMEERTFNAAHTRRLHLFGLGGDDTFTVRGRLPAGLAVALYDGAGRDQFTFGPDLQAPDKVVVRESGDGNQLAEHPAVKIEAYQPRADEFNAAGWLLRHRLY